MLNRRGFVFGMPAGAAAMVAHPALVRAQPREALADEAGAILGDDRFPPDQPVPTLDEILELELALTGEHSPYPEEVALGRRILGGPAPDLRPYDTAQFFQALRLREFIEEYGEDSPGYATEWPYRANPVIVSFFDATETRTPNGDVTPWCAAFVNWCYRHVRGEPATNSAASATFRNWKTQTADPQPGDIAVFRRVDSPNQGHVGFFVGFADGEGRYIFVLGGNQSPSSRRNSGEVNIKRFDTQSTGNLRFHSFRTDSSLH